MTAVNSPTVSVIMPMRNTQAYVAQAIDSVLNQSFKDLELIVIDDQSTDQSRHIVENLLDKDQRLKLISGSAKGIAAAKNTGLAQASGEFVMFCDADDLYSEDCIEKQLNSLRQNPQAGAVCAQFAMMNPDGGNIVMIDADQQPCDITGELLSGNTQTHTHLCTYFIKRAFIEKISGFREYFISAEDVDFQFRLAEVCKVMFMPYVTYYYRLHDSSITHTLPNTRKLFFDHTARAFRQQRTERGEDDLQRGCPPPVPEGVGLPPDPKKQLQNALIASAWDLHKRNQKREAIKNGWRACLTVPSDLITWKSFIMLLVK